MLDFENFPIIAAVRSEDDFKRALASDVQTIFLLSSNIMTVEDYAMRAHERSKLLYVHVDFVDGLSKDASGVRYLATKNIDGIISTRSNVISVAHDCGISSIQRFFMIDARSGDTALDTLKTSKADMVEIMPGIAYKAIKRIKDRSGIPIIAGGLIEQKDEVFAAINAGASVISTGNCELWND